MEIIGAGLAKTGTTSLHRALEILGYAPVYHHEEHVQNHLAFWEGVYSGEIQNPDFATEYAGVRAITDTPASYFFEEFLAAFPDAKVILTVRDNEEQWYSSYCRLRRGIQSFPTILTMISPWLYRVVRLDSIVLMTVYGGLTPSICKRRYRQHNDHVKAVVPASQLLVYNVKEGWKPLCDFLRKEIPDEPFPWLNTAVDENNEIAELKKKAALISCYILGCLSLVSFAVWKHCR